MYYNTLASVISLAVLQALMLLVIPSFCVHNIEITWKPYSSMAFKREKKNKKLSPE